MNRDNIQNLHDMTTQGLDELLREELAKRPLNDDLIRRILEILKKRETAEPEELTEEEAAAWENFEERYAKEKDSVMPKGSAAGRKLAIWISAIAACFVIVVFAPTVFGSSNVVDFFQQLTSGTIRFFHPGNANEDYVFETDNPGLQEVYDAVTELGITEPVVPMWLPEGYVLEEIKVGNTPAKTKVYSNFKNNRGYVTLILETVGYDTKSTIETDYPEATTCELDGRKYYLTTNDGTQTIAWSIDDAICLIYTNEKEEVWMEILRSIHVKR